ncbi:MAG: hypothetical protein GDA45_04060 [Chromatiales bacterium]|nr:hypothetical protein [Chromatiales bacterium]
MIISHKLKFIYIKLMKIAGTSFEVALSKYCGPKDIITPINDQEHRRKSLGFCGAQNYSYSDNPYLDSYLKLRLYYFIPKVIHRLLDLNHPITEFSAHTSAREIKRRLPSTVWRNYLKVATIRCPYDTYISAYYYFKYSEFEIIHQKNKPIENFKKFVTKHQTVLDYILELHDKNGKMLTDFLIRYEHINEDIESLSKKINTPGLLSTFEAHNVGGDLRPKLRASSCEMYTKYPNAKLILDEKFGKYADRYEFFEQYWPSYKSALEEAIKEHSL